MKLDWGSAYRLQPYNSIANRTNNTSMSMNLRAQTDLDSL
jgi:hypothetical protein